jgi:hypothetical protein
LLQGDRRLGLAANVTDFAQEAGGGMLPEKPGDCSIGSFKRYVMTWNGVRLPVGELKLEETIGKSEMREIRGSVVLRCTLSVRIQYASRAIFIGDRKVGCVDIRRPA